MIYDCFIFFNELDILEIRLNILDDVVDKFVLVESPWTHRGEDKPLFYAENQARFNQFHDKIIHIVSYPPTTWQADDPRQTCFFENHQRDAIMQGLEDCRPDDVVLISDADEIPNPKKILACLDLPGIKVFEQKLMYYYLNLQCWTKKTWLGTRMGRLADLLDPAQDLPPDSVYYYFSRKGLPTYFRFCDGVRISDGGWHFSYCGGVETILRKMNAIFDHLDPKFSDIVANADAHSVRRTVLRGQDIYGRREYFYVIVSLNELPQYVRENFDRYGDLILFRNFKERFAATAYFLANMTLFLLRKIKSLMKLMERKLIRPLAHKFTKRNS